MTARANSQRGEVELRLGNNTHVLRPSFENLVAAEDELGSLFALVERAAEGAITLAEITSLLWHCLTNEPRPERDAFGQAVLQIGMVDATKPVRAILAQVLQGNA